jgi:hypothetical protein
MAFRRRSQITVGRMQSKGAYVCKYIARKRVVIAHCITLSIFHPPLLTLDLWELQLVHLFGCSRCLKPKVDTCDVELCQLWPLLSILNLWPWL